MSLTRQTFRHAAVYSVGTVLARVVGFIMLPFYANVFETEGYGVIALIDASQSLLVIAIASGFHNAIVRIYHEEGPERGGTVLGSAIVMTLVLSLAVVALPWIFGTPLSRVLLGNAQYVDLWRLSLLSFVIDVTGQSASAYLIIRQRSVTYSAISLLRLILALSINIWLVFGLHMGLKGVFVSTLLSATLSTTLYLTLVARNTSLRVDRTVVRKIVHYQLPILPGDLIAVASRQAERYLVRYLIDIRAAGVLEMAYKFPPLINIVITIPFLKAWNTKCIELAETTDTAAGMIGAMFTRFYMAVVIFGLLLAVAIGDLLRILTPPDFWPAVGIARIEILTTILNGSSSFLVFGLVYRKRTGIISAIRTCGAILKVPLAVFMIGTFQLGGAAYAALLVELCTCAAILRYSQKSFHVHYEMRKVALISGYAALVYATVWIARLPERFQSAQVGHLIMQTLTTLAATESAEGSHLARFIETLAAREQYIASLVINLLLAALLLGAGFGLPRVAAGLRRLRIA